MTDQESLKLCFREERGRDPKIIRVCRMMKTGEVWMLVCQH